MWHNSDDSSDTTGMLLGGESEHYDKSGECRTFTGPAAHCSLCDVNKAWFSFRLWINVFYSCGFYFKESMNIRFNNNSVAESSPKESIIQSGLSSLLLKKYSRFTKVFNLFFFFLLNKRTDLGPDSTDLCLEWVLAKLLWSIERCHFWPFHKLCWQKENTEYPQPYPLKNANTDISFS